MASLCKSYQMYRSLTLAITLRSMEGGESGAATGAAAATSSNPPSRRRAIVTSYTSSSSFFTTYLSPSERRRRSEFRRSNCSKAPSRHWATSRQCCSECRSMSCARLTAYGRRSSAAISSPSNHRSSSAHCSSGSMGFASSTVSFPVVTKLYSPSAPTRCSVRLPSPDTPYRRRRCSLVVAADRTSSPESLLSFSNSSLAPVRSPRCIRDTAWLRKVCASLIVSLALVNSCSSKASSCSHAAIISAACLTSPPSS
mmetsp:Transcript_16395/g.41893  ORF Transcript_16395/g.41893 Transcript_16395/m.41893 type:complete len:255 (+) Transcript_16395:670-1434(+)